MSVTIAPSFGLNYFGVANPQVAQDQQHKFICVRLVMTQQLECEFHLW
jgi:hypothetical protein